MLPSRKFVKSSVHFFGFYRSNYTAALLRLAHRVFFGKLLALIAFLKSVEGEEFNVFDILSAVGQ
jgi:hypothetical protein